jgi:hypothetical protein
MDRKRNRRPVVCNVCRKRKVKVSPAARTSSPLFERVGASPNADAFSCVIPVVKTKQNRTEQVLTEALFSVTERSPPAPRARSPTPSTCVSMRSARPAAEGAPPATALLLRRPLPVSVSVSASQEPGLGLPTTMALTSGRLGTLPSVI